MQCCMYILVSSDESFDTESTNDVALRQAQGPNYICLQINFKSFFYAMLYVYSYLCR